MDLVTILILAAIIIILWPVLKFAVEAISYSTTDYCSQTKKSYWSVIQNTGTLGEYKIYEYLTKLNGYKKFLFNVYVPKEDGSTTEIDVILIHESGIYVFESKNYSGWIFGTESQQYWTQTLPSGKGHSQKERFFNPIIQNNVHLKWLRNYLQNDSIPLYSYIVFSERCKLKDVKLTSEKHHVINRYNVLNSVRELASENAMSLSNETVDKLYEQLYPLTQASEDLKQEHIANIKNNHFKPVQNNNDELQNIDLEATKEKEENEDIEKNEENENIAMCCPKCGGKLVLRVASKGERAGQQFWGCSNFPKCRYIKNNNI